MKKIHTMIIGAQKCATTSIHKQLGQHPDISIHAQTEFSAFIDSPHDINSIISKSFPLKDEKLLLGKNVSICRDNKYIERLSTHNRNIKLVYIIRNPVDRFISAWNMSIFDGWNKITSIELYDELCNEDKFINSNSLYAPFRKESFINRLFIQQGYYSKVIKYLESSGIDFKIVSYDQYKINPHITLSEICEFMGIDSFSFDVSKRYNETKAAKSKLITYSMNYIKENKTTLKKVLKIILGNKIFSKIAFKLNEFNKSSKEIDNSWCTNEIRTLLNNVYKKEIDYLSKKKYI